MPPDPVSGKARVRFVLHTFDRGGSGRVAAYLTRGFADQGFDVELIVFASGGDAQAAIEELAPGSLPVRYLGRSSGVRPLDLLRGLPALVRRLRLDKPDVVVAAANNVALITAIALRMAGLDGTRLFLKTTNPIASSRHRGLTRAIRRWTYGVAFRFTSSVLTLSADEADEMRRAYPGFQSIFRNVANPYVTPAMLAAPDEPQPSGADKVVISVARLAAQKRLDRLIAAFAHVRTPGARLLILGEGEDRADLQALVDRLELRGRVSMPGFSSDVAQALHAANLFVLTSAYEGLPAVVLEAMAANCPVLTTDCFPAARSLIDRAESCAIIEDSGPLSLAAQIDRHLAAQRPTSLRSIAAHYSIESGIASHREAMAL